MSGLLSQVFVLVSDLQESRYFLEECIGVEASETGDESATYRAGDMEFKIREDYDEDALDEFNLELPRGDRGSGVFFVFETDDDINEVYRRIDSCSREIGVEALTEVRDVDWGGTMFLVRDPDGYIFEIR